MMREFVAETSAGPKLRAWLYPENPRDDLADPHAVRPGGWRIVIENLDTTDEDPLIRSTWEQYLHEVLRHMEIYWPEVPVWRDYATGEIVDLNHGDSAPN